MWTIYSVAICIVLAYAAYQGVSWSPSAFRYGLCIYRETADGWKAIPGSLVNRSMALGSLRLKFLSDGSLAFRTEPLAGKRMPPGTLHGDVTWTAVDVVRIELPIPVSALMLVGGAGVGLGLAAREGESPVVAYLIAFVLLCGMFAVFSGIDQVSMLHGVSALEDYLRGYEQAADQVSVPAVRGAGE